jgi:hypothetical protein
MLNDLGVYSQIAIVRQSLTDVRIIPESSPIADIGGRLKSDATGREQMQHRDADWKFDYSITSSAMASTPGGIVRPSVLAVLRLMTNSNLVGCWTGRSEGLAPFNILST